jgi:hypothetical protein
MNLSAHLPLGLILSLSAIAAATAAAIMAGDGDPLKAINDELRGKINPESSGPWLPLESNPEVFTSFGKRVGLQDGWSFVDVLGVSRSGCVCACVRVCVCACVRDSILVTMHTGREGS